MLKPRLESFSNEVLICLSKYYDYDKEILEILKERYMEEDYKRLYVSFRKSEGTNRTAIADAIAYCLKSHEYFIESDMLNEVLDEIDDIDLLWSLCKVNNIFIKEKALSKLYVLLDEIQRDFVDEETEDYDKNNNVGNNIVRMKIFNERKDEE